MKILLLNQTFHPDVMATAQYLAQLACALAERGHEVTVVTSRRAYDEPQRQFPAQESWRGVRICRVASTTFGKRTKWRRTADFASFILSCCLRLVLLPRQDVVMALTSPPLISFIGAWLARLRGSRFVYWVMDFNPDEAIAAGWLRPGSFAARLLERMSRFSLQRARRIIALDRFMRDRIVAKGIPADKVVVLPPWSQDDRVNYDVAGRERFRSQHGLQNKFVVMYSGNHSPIHPLDTLLDAAQRLANERDIVFCFIGGGSEFQRVQRLASHGMGEATANIEHPTSNIQHREQSSKIGSPLTFSDGDRVADRSGEGHSQPSTFNHQRSNLVCFPYQPQEQLAASLSAADVHVVVMGNAFVGLVHPCKIYNILGVGAPVIYLGPQPSHVSEILDAMGCEYPCASVAHGDVESLVQGIQRLRLRASSLSRQTLAQTRARFSRESLLTKLIAELEVD